jgi:hypothetical protein
MEQSQSFLMAETSHSWHESRQLSIIQVESQQSLLQKVDESKRYSTSSSLLSSSWIQAVIPPSGNPGCHYSAILIHAVIIPSAESMQLFFYPPGNYHSNSCNTGSQYFSVFIEIVNISAAVIQTVIIPPTIIQAAITIQLKFRQSLFL